MRKPRRRSPRELRTRAVQALAAMHERSPLATHAEPELADVFVDGRSADRALDAFRERSAPRLSNAFVDPARSRALLRRQLHGVAAEELVAHADRLVAGRFDLLGFAGLSFGSPPDWQLDPIAGVRAPAVHWSRLTRPDQYRGFDPKVTWELNRHQWLVTLGRAYWLTGDDRYAETFAERLCAWLDANPRGAGINWASSLELAYRSIAWTWSLCLFRDSTRLTAELFERSMKSLWLQSRHVATFASTYSSPNTHLTGEALGLYCVGTLWPELRGAEAWRATGRRTLLSALERQVTADGVYFERASAYHLYTTSVYTHFVVLAEQNGDHLPAIARDRLVALHDHLLYIARPDGSIPLIGDDDGGRLLALGEERYGDARPQLALGALLLARPDYKLVGRRATEEMLWQLGPDAVAEFDQLEPRQPVSPSRAFPAGGVFVMRSGWSGSASVLTIDCGEHGGPHDHAGALGFDLAVSGRPLLVDPGTHTYRRSAGEPDWFRSTAAHNTVVVDDESSSLPGGPFGWRTRARAYAREWWTDDRYDFFEGAHDGYRRLSDPVEHVRAILHVRDAYWVIRDRLDATHSHRYSLRFHFAPGAQPTLDGDRTYTLIRESSLEIATFGPGTWQLGSEQVSRCYGAAESAPVAERTVVAAGPQELITFLLLPSAESVHEVPATGGRAFEVRGPEIHDLFVSGDQPVVEAGGVEVPVTARFGCGLARTVEGRLVAERLGPACAA